MVSKIVKEGVKGGLCQLDRDQLDNVINHEGPMKLDGLVYEDGIG